MHLRLYLLSFAVGCSLESHPCVVAAKRKEAVKTERRHDILQLSPECKRGNGDSCNALGDIYATPEWGGGKMVTVAKHLNNRACENGNGEGCYQIGAWGSGCELGHTHSCELAGCVSIEMVTASMSAVQ
jgi:TPR repeat protein